jgi:hypothetical protein
MGFSGFGFCLLNIAVFSPFIPTSDNMSPELIDLFDTMHLVIQKKKKVTVDWAHVS